VGGALFVTNKYVPNRVIKHRVVRGEDGSTWIPENGVYPFMNKAFPDDLRACALAWHVVQFAPHSYYQSN
jgi:hypothetical protein